MFEPLLICTLCVKLQGSFSVLVCITCIILCLFCALNRGVGAFQFPSLLLLLSVTKKRESLTCAAARLQDVSEFQHKLLEWLEDAFTSDQSRPVPSSTPTAE